MPLLEHCAYRYLLHLPGVTYAARLKYLLACNATVVAPWLGRGGSRYDGGWVEFYYSALEPGVHYADVGEGGAGASAAQVAAAGSTAGAADVVRAVAALAADEARARAIAAAGAAFVTEHLSMEAVWRYWRVLLARYAALQRGGVTLHPDAVPFEDSILPGHERLVFRCRRRERQQGPGAVAAVAAAGGAVSVTAGGAQHDAGGDDDAFE